VFRGFQHDNNYDIIVAQPAAMAHGLTLTAANTIVWYAPTVRNEIYEQANARVRRPGQKHSQLIVNVSGSNIERKTYARLKDKQSMQGLVFDAIMAAWRALCSTGSVAEMSPAHRACLRAGFVRGWRACSEARDLTPQQ
jgi:SNF2 family DNA or RNA helicase